MKETSSDKLAYNILLLQNLIKRDPPSYLDEFFTQYQHYKCLMELFKSNPKEYNKNVADLVMFIAQVSSCYKEHLYSFPRELMQVLRDFSTVLDPSMRLSFCKALILMRNRNVVDPTDLIKLCFELLRCKDKILRSYLEIFIVSDIKNLNAKHKNTQVNTAVQNFMYKMLEDKNAIAAKVSLDIMVELYRRHIWRDAKTVNTIATACLSKVNKILVAVHKFFLGVDEDDENSDSSDDEEEVHKVKEAVLSTKVNKKSRKRLKLLQRTKQVLKKSKKKKKKEVFDFSALHLIHDPQGMAEKLLKKVNAMNEKYEIKLLVMNLISRLVGVHELVLLNYYPLLIRYLKPHQRDVTQILMFAAQSSHENVPPDVMGSVVRTIADNFITERNSSEVITVGLNSIREICIRCPLAIEQDLLQDLVQYQKYKDKNVMMAARSLVQLFRKKNPQLLQRKFRTRPTEMTKGLELAEYGASKAKSFIPGSEVLPLEPSQVSGDKEGDNEDGNDSDGSWVDIPHSDDEDNEDPDIEDDNELEESKKSDDLNSTKTVDEKDTKDASVSKSESRAQSTSDQQKAMVVSQSRILSQEEFEKMKVAQLRKELQFTKGKKRKAESDSVELEEFERTELVPLRKIEKLYKKTKIDKGEKDAAVKDSKESRENFGKKKKTKSEFASKSNKERKKNKNFMMIKHKVRSKVKRSFKDKQIALRNALLKRKRHR